MPLLIDGHNLIGQMSTISLGDEDDELQLVQLLRLYVNQRRGGRAIVVFDGGVPGHPTRLDGYGIETEFARAPGNADSLLIKRIGALTNPGGWQLVTSDREVALAGRRRGLTVISSREFAQRLEMLGRPQSPVPNPDSKPRLKVGEHEIAEWLELFGVDPADADRVDLPYEFPPPPARKGKRRKKK